MGDAKVSESIKIQDLRDGRIDMQTVSVFANADENTEVPRRLAPPVKSMSYYTARLDEAKNSADAAVETIPRTVNDAINNTAAIGGILADTFVTATARDTGMVARSQRAKNAEQVSVKDYGALGDGSGQTVINWYTIGATNYRGYANLAAVQADYPHVTSTDDTIDWAGSQAAVNSNAKRVMFASGSHVFNKPLKTKHTGSYYRHDTGQVLFGEGVSTVLTRKDRRVATRVSPTATNEEKAAADIANANECCIAVHGSNMDMYGFRIEDSAIGIYLGQDHSIIEDGGASHNSFDKITVKNCGTGIIMAASQGNHYNDFSRIHFVQCQLDLHMKNGARWTGSNNNNRNTFFKMRSARSRAGLWIESGDSNVAYSWHGEGCGTSATGNTFPIPTYLPESITSGVHIIGGQLNRIFSSQMEANEIELYNYGFNNEFYANGYHEGVANGTQVINKTRPAKFISQNTLFMPNLAIIANNNKLAFPDIKKAGAPTFSGTAVVNNVAYTEHTNPTNTNTRHTSRIHALGGILKNDSTTAILWTDYSPFETASFRIKVVASSSNSNLAFVVTADAVAMRNNSSTLIRYYLITDKAFQATGENTGSLGTSEVLNLSLIAVGKDLILNVKAPLNRDLDAVSVYVDTLVCKAP